MDKNTLGQLKFLEGEIKGLKKRIEKAEYEVECHTTIDSVRGSSPAFPFGEHSIKISGLDIDDYDRRVNRLKATYQRRIDDLMDKKEEIEAYIESIEDSEMRQIISLRYVNGLEWKEIAANMGCKGDGSTERKKHNRFLGLL